MNPFAGLLQSRKFWLLILDSVVALVLYFVGKYAPGVGADVEFVILVMQPVFIVIIAAIAWEDAAAKRSGNFPY